MWLIGLQPAIIKCLKKIIISENSSKEKFYLKVIHSFVGNHLAYFS